MIKTNVVKIGDKNIIITLKKGTFWSRYRGSMSVAILTTGWHLNEYEEKIKGDYALLHELFIKFEENEIESIIRRYESKIKRN